MVATGAPPSPAAAAPGVHTLCVQHVAGVLLSESEMEEWTCVPARVLGESWPTKHSKANQAQAAVRSTLRNSRTREDLKQQQAHNGMH